MNASPSCWPHIRWPWGALSRRPLINPLLPSGADPWVTSHGGFYYYMNTTGNSLAIWKARNMADLAQAEKKVVWRPPASGPYSRDIWAPELHFLRGKWYIYFAADAGTNASHRIWVLENDSEDPLAGEWRMKGKVTDATDRWAIDATVFEDGSRLYMVWSGWEGEVNGAQNLYIAELSDPWTVKGPRVRISAPDLPWERWATSNRGATRRKIPALNQLDPLHVDVNEGPEILRRGNRIFVVYSAGGCWTDYYSMGMLTAKAGSNLLNPASWKKSPLPVFWQSPKAARTAPDTAVSSVRPTAARAGCSTTPIPRPDRAAAAGARRARSPSPGSPTARRISDAR